ncbi:MAG: hypothetical protein M1816_002193 [Peltula sp. TS41687]|nr:MAG: hypothetical protein M1816_002193 [Peltula sp. TS41687]
MTSFFGKLRVGAGGTSPSIGSSPSKRHANNTPQTPLGRLLEDAGPLREDGSDKFFGMENFGNTCYCNSILQCLYYSVPFREHVIRYPTRSPRESLQQTPNGLPPSTPRLNLNPSTYLNGFSSSPSPMAKLNGAITANSPARKALNGPTSPGLPGSRPEDKPDSAEYKKKQAMMAGPVLNMDYDNAGSYGMSESLFTSLKDIFEAIVAHQSRSGIVSPQKFFEILKRDNETFRSSMHQDAHEFLNIVLNQVVANVETSSKHQAMNGGFSDSVAAVLNSTAGIHAGPTLTSATTTGWVHELFEGTLTSETKCLTCENTSSRDEPFLDLSVDLDDNSSVTSCLRKFSEEEMLCERNKFHCDNCRGLQEAEKRMKIKRLPRILALHLKRFKYTEDLQRLQKLFHRVVYPYHLRLFNTTDDAEDPDRLYELYAVVVHIGSGPYHGHYVSVIKSPDRGWLLFDDEMVEPVDKSYVQNFFGDQPGQACAYVLFYQETTEEAVRKEQEAERHAPNKGSQTSKIGKPNGSLANGTLHPIQTTPLPVTVEDENGGELDQVVTALPRSPLESSQQTSQSDFGHVVSSSPNLNNGSLFKSKTERAEEEKRNKIAEKERQRAERQRLKELDTERKEQEKRQKEEAKLSAVASKQSKAGDATRPDQEAENEKEQTNGSGGVMSNSLNRFRQTSKSLRRPRFWISKDREEMPKDATESVTSNGPTVQDSPFVDEETESLKPLPEKAEKPDKSKGYRFSIRKKSSTLFS